MAALGLLVGREGGKMRRFVLEYWPPLSSSYEVYAPRSAIIHVPASWLGHIRYFVSSFRGSILISDAWVPSPPRHQDTSLMDAILRYPDRAIRSSGPVDADPMTLSSFRAELSGILGAVILLDLIVDETPRPVNVSHLPWNMGATKCYPS